MRFVVLGAGAIGGVVAGRLAKAGLEVVAIARGAHLDAIRGGGLRVEAPDETFAAHIAAVEHPARIAWRPDDVVLLAVKTQDVAAAVRALPAELGVACLTNGVEAERLALRAVRHVYGACVMMPAAHLAPGVVQVFSSPVPGRIDLGRYPGGDDATAAAIAGALRAAGFASDVRADIMRWKRGKLLSNLANAVEALCGLTGRSSEIARLARAEGLACFAAAGLSSTTADEDAALRAELRVGTIAGANRAGGSTWQSLARRAGSVETDYLNGEIALLGRLHGVPAPINEGLQRLAAEAARAGTPPGSMPLAELEARLGLRRVG